MTGWNGTRLAAGIAAALLLGGTALAQGTGSSGTPAGTGTEPSDSAAATRGTPTTPGGSDTAAPSRSDTAGSTGTATGSTDTAPSGSTGTATGSTDTTPAPSGSTASDTSSATKGAAATASAGKVDKGLEQGLQKLHAANQAEIQMGQMAAQSAQDPQVKQFAQQMVDDHQKNDQQLEQLAQQAGVTLQGSAFDKASKQSEKDMGKLHGQAGADFDKRYMSHMVKDHQKDVKDVASLAKRAHKVKQTELASFLDQTHSAMQGHLEQAKTIEKASKGERHGRRGAARSSSGMSTPSSDTGSTGTSTGSETSPSSGTTAPSDTGSPGAEQQPRKP